MADRIVITGMHREYDGEYEFDGSSLTNRELHLVKRLSGCRVLELEDALNAGDTDVVMAIGIVAVMRHGKEVDEDVFWNAQAGAIAMESDEVEEDAPLATLPAADNGSQNESSGRTSDSTSESPENGQSPIGSPRSGTLSTAPASAPATSVTSRRAS